MSTVNTDKFAILIAGTRTYDDYEQFKNIVDSALVNHTPENTVIISGGATGADCLAERYAKERNIEIIIMPADWDKYGKSAGPTRNRAMHVKLSGYENRGCLCFWDGKSKGTYHNFKLAKEFNTPLKVFGYRIGRYLKQDQKGTFA